MTWCERHANLDPPRAGPGGQQAAGPAEWIHKEHSMTNQLPSLRLLLVGLGAAGTTALLSGSGAHLLHYGPPSTWSADHDAELVVLTRQ